MRIRTHPGEVLKHEFMEPHGLSARKLAGIINVSHTAINKILRQTGGVSADIANRLAVVFGTTPEFWLNLQTAHDMSKAQAENAEDYAKITELKCA